MLSFVSTKALPRWSRCSEYLGPPELGSLGFTLFNDRHPLPLNDRQRLLCRDSTRYGLVAMFCCRFDNEGLVDLRTIYDLPRPRTETGPTRLGRPSHFSIFPPIPFSQSPYFVETSPIAVTLNDREYETQLQTCWLYARLLFD